MQIFVIKFFVMCELGPYLKCLPLRISNEQSHSNTRRPCDALQKAHNEPPTEEIHAEISEGDRGQLNQRAHEEREVRIGSDLGQSEEDPVKDHGDGHPLVEHDQAANQQGSGMKEIRDTWLVFRVESLDDFHRGIIIVRLKEI